jgi:hypothetical protein
LYFDDLGNAASTKEVLAVSNHRVLEDLHAHGAFLLTFYDKLESLLEESSVLIVEYDDVLFLEKFHQIGDAVFAKGPMVTPALVSASFDPKSTVSTHVWRRRRSLSRTPWNLPFWPDLDLSCHEASAP